MFIFDATVYASQLLHIELKNVSACNLNFEIIDYVIDQSRDWLLLIRELIFFTQSCYQNRFGTVSDIAAATTFQRRLSNLLQLLLMIAVRLIRDGC